MSAPSRPLPEISALTEPYWSALARDVLRFQRCGRCGHAWLPARDACPRCLAPDSAWEDAGGQGRLVSWVVYHTLYHPYFADKLPYTVAVVELREGPRLIAGIEGDPPRLAIDLPLVLQVRHEGDAHFPTFVAAG